jgi:hypothetical protein
MKPKHKWLEWVEAGFWLAVAMSLILVNHKGFRNYVFSLIFPSGPQIGWVDKLKE